VLIRVLAGGAHEPALAAAPDADLVDLARDTLRRACALAAAPSFIRVIRHARGIPQYTLGHAARLAAIDARVARFPGLVLTGNSYRGVSVNACVSEAKRVAAELQ
jgi:oxygen-dependent protoporphyrinogen oxidase